MFNFLKTKRPKTEQPSSTPPVSVSPHSLQHNSDVRRELIRVVLKDTLRHHAIPLSWLACEVTAIARAPGEEELNIQLVVMKWNEQLLRYAPALQQQFLLGLDRFDPSVDHSKYSVSWRFSPDCGYPFSKMPIPKVWLRSESSPLNEEPLSILDRRHSKRPSDEPALNLAASESRDRAFAFLPPQIMPLV